jgi:hypothetical protein
MKTKNIESYLSTLHSNSTQACLRACFKFSFSYLAHR